MENSLQYSKLKYIRLINFMVFEDETVYVGEDGILNLVGYNDSGKSTVIRAIAILLYDTGPMDQASEVRKGQEESDIRIGFDDGVEISKIKKKSGNSLWFLKKDGETIYTNQNGNAVIAVTGVPEQIAKYLNVGREEVTKSNLNVRTRHDAFFLVSTGGADNYKMLNSILNCSILTEAVTKMKEDRNRTQNAIVNCSAEVRTLESELSLIEVLDDHTVRRLEQATENLVSAKKRVDYYSSITALKQNIEEIVIPDELQAIDLTRYYEIKSLIDLRNQVEELEMMISAEVEMVPTQRYNEIQALLSLRATTEVIYAKEEVPVVSLERYSAIKSIYDQYHQLMNNYREQTAVTNELTEVNNILHNLSVEHNYKMCKNCGSVVV